MLESIINTFSTYPLQVIGLLVFTPILIMMLYEFRYNQKNQLEKRVKGYIRNGKDEKVIDRAVGAASRYLGEKGDTIQLKLERANILFKKEEYLALLIIGVVAGAAIGFVIFPFGTVFKSIFGFIVSPFVQIFFARVLAAAVFGAIGYFLPEVYIKYLIFDRRRLLDEQIEDTLLQLADALRSGAGPNVAIRIASEELKYPMKDEFYRTHQEISANKPFDDAIEDLKKRVDLDDFSFAMSAVQIQTETGAELEPLLRDIVKVVGDRKILKKELQKAIATSKGTGIILMVAPVLFTVVFSNMNSEAYGEMLKSPMGIAMIVIGVVSYLIGSGIILKIIRDISKLT